MTRSKLVLLFLFLSLLAGSAGFYTQQYLQTKAAQQRPDFSLPDMHDQLRHISEWDGKVILLNFWASWCPPCREELPDFVRLYENYGAQGFVVVGVAIDKKQDIADFMDSVGVEYPVMISELEGIRISQTYGNRLGALPYSVIINREGQIISSHTRLLTYADVEGMIRPLL